MVGKVERPLFTRNPLVDREGKLQFSRLSVGEIDGLRESAESLVPGFYRVGSEGETLQPKCPVGAGRVEERVFDDSDIGLHPCVEIACESDHHSGRGKVIE